MNNKVLSVGDMLDEVRKLGFEAEQVYTLDKEAIAIKAQIGDTFIVSKVFRLVNSRNYDPNRETNYAIERDFVLKDLINRCLKIKKEKEMSNNIEWRVKEVTLDRRFGETPVFEANISGTMNGVVVGDLNDISNKLQKKLNEPEKCIDSDTVYEYILNDIRLAYSAKDAINRRFGTNKLPAIKKVIFNNPATIVMWADETKTVVKAQNNEIFDPEKGLAMAITKKALGNEGNYFEVIKKHVTEYQNSGSFVIDEFGESVSQLTAKMAATDARRTLNKVLNNKKATKAELYGAVNDAIRYLNKGLDT